MVRYDKLRLYEQTKECLIVGDYDKANLFLEILMGYAILEKAEAESYMELGKQIGQTEIVKKWCSDSNHNLKGLQRILQSIQLNNPEES